MLARAGKPTVLVFARFYLPGFKAGGPIRTIANLVEALGDDIDFRIVTSDRDATDRAPYPDLPGPGSWTDIGKARVLYLAPQEKRLRRIAEILRSTPYDTLYLNSFFDPVFTCMPLLVRRLGPPSQRRCIVAPRGEFSAGALDLKRFRKRLYLWGVQMGALYRDVTWQASSDVEAADIRRALSDSANDIRVAANLPEALVRGYADLYRPRAPGEPLRICFLSRISPMKNLDFALEILRDVHVSVRFDIYGPIRDDAYWLRCQERLAQLPPHMAWSFNGPVDNAGVRTVLQQYDLLLLPTRGENFGHIILESLTAGTPVVISDATPWRDLETIGVGWDLPLGGLRQFTSVIDKVSHMPAERMLAMRAQARAFGIERRSDPRTIAANRALFTAALAEKNSTT